MVIEPDEYKTCKGDHGLIWIVEQALKDSRRPLMVRRCMSYFKQQQTRKE